MSRLYRCEHCGETLSSPSKNYDCPLAEEIAKLRPPPAPPGQRRRDSGLSDAEVLRIQSDEFADASPAEIAEAFKITPLYAITARANGRKP